MIELKLMIMILIFGGLFGYAVYAIVNVVRDRKKGKNQKQVKEKQKPIWFKNSKGKLIKQAMFEYKLLINKKDGSVQEIVFSAEEENLSRDEAVLKYFNQANGMLCMKSDENKAVEISRIKAYSLEKIEEENLLNIPESVGSVSLTELPESNALNGIENVEKVKSIAEPAVFLSAKEIKTLRTEKELTQKALGNLANINPNRLSKIEREIVKATEEEMVSLASILIDVEPFVESSDGNVVVENIELSTENVYFEESEKESIVLKEPEIKDSIPFAINKKKFFKKKQKEEKPMVVPVGKKKISSGFRVVLWSVIVLGVTGAFLSYNNSRVATASSKGLETTVTALEKQLNKPVVERDSKGHIQSYFASFLPVYLNTYSDSKLRGERETELGMYFDPSFEIENPSIDQRLKNTTFYDLVDEGNCQVIRYIVTYELENQDDNLMQSAKDSTKTDSGKTDSVVDEIDEEKKQYTQMLSIPFVEVDGLFAIVDYPYFSLAPDQKGVAERLLPDFGNALSKEETGNLDEFLEQFYKNYASNSVEDMAYMMNNPESLDGQFEYEKSENNIYEGKTSDFIVVSEVTFKTPDTPLNHKERMQLSVEKQEDGKYFVKKLNHNIGGNE